MSYRKIEVDGKTYEYTIGKTACKVKGVGIIQRPADEDYWSVKPHDVVNFIKRKINE